MLLRFPIAPCKILPTTRLMTTTTDTATILTLFCQGSTNQNSNFLKKKTTLSEPLKSPLKPLTMVIFPLLTHHLWAQEIPGIDNKLTLFSYLSFQYQSVFLGFLASKSIVQFSCPFHFTRGTSNLIFSSYTEFWGNFFSCFSRVGKILGIGPRLGLSGVKLACNWLPKNIQASDWLKESPNQSYSNFEIFDHPILIHSF